MGAPMGNKNAAGGRGGSKRGFGSTKKTARQKANIKRLSARHKYTMRNRIARNSKKR